MVESEQVDVVNVRLIDKFCTNNSNQENVRPKDVLKAKGANPFDEIANDRELARQVILQMALQRNAGDEKETSRESIETAASTDSEGTVPKTVIEEGFFWRDFPMCEQVLYTHMCEYYSISIVQRQSKMQQTFNKRLVQEVRSAAVKAGISFDPSFNEKKLRDRIRCFYKTHLQNAKKRLVTLQKRPDSLNNQSILRVFIRCVKTGISFAESLDLEEPVQHKKGRLSHVEKAKQSLLQQQQMMNHSPIAAD